MKALIVILVSLISLSANAADYTLVCRGGRLVTGMWQFPSDSGTWTIEDYDFIFNFSKSPVRAQAPYTNLPAGTCAWEDRPLNSNEQSVLVLRKAPFIGRLKMNLRLKKVIKVTPALDVRRPNGNEIVKKLTYFMSIAGQDHGILKFRAKSMPGNDTRLLITRLGN